MRKTCATCGRYKLLGDFFRAATNRDGRQGRCKLCAKEIALRTKYGITLEEYDRILQSQNGGCGICHTTPSETRTLDVDHCHETGRVRGLLCNQCNQGIGLFLDSAALLQSATDYLSNSVHTAGQQVEVG